MSSVRPIGDGSRARRETGIIRCRVGLQSVNSCGYHKAGVNRSRYFQIGVLDHRDVAAIERVSASLDLRAEDLELEAVFFPALLEYA